MPALAVRESVEPDAVRPVARRTLSLALLLLVLGLATFLPGTGRTLPGTTVSVYDLVVAVGTAAVVVWLVRSAPDVAALVEAAIEGPQAVVTDLGRTAEAGVWFLTVLVAYRGFAALVVPPLARADAAWSYDLAFLLAGLATLAVIANRLRRNIDAVADLLAEAVGEPGDAEAPDDRSGG